MFLKPYKLKKNTPLKGSETKKLRQSVEKAFPHAVSSLDVLLPPKATVSVIKLETHANFVGNVFCVNRLPMFFEYDESGALAPTLYALWLLPDLLPYFTTHKDVLPRLANGADLMLPGVIPQGTGLSMYGHYKANQLVAINLTSNESAVGVGCLIRSSEDLYMCGGRGSAVKTLHLFGDKLWGHEPSLTQQVPNKKKAPLTKDDFPELGAAPNRPKKESADKPKTLADIVAQTEVRPAEEEFPDLTRLTVKDTKVEENDEEKGSPAEPVAAEEAEDPDSDTDELTPEQKLKNAFLGALKNNRKNLQLPLLTSNFFRLYVVPEASEQIDLKKTKYKKLSNFLAQMIEEGFIVVREETKGIDKITSIDFEHPEVVNFITDVKKPDASKEANGEPKPLFHSELTELYLVTNETAPFFTKMNFKRGEGIPVAQIRKIVREYISQQNLPVANQSTKTIKLDETLKQICGCDAATLRDICNTLVSRMEHSYQMCSAKEAPSNKPLIQMSLATRAGNKKVTLVSNVECYGIIIPEFIKLCKQGAAASTTVVKLPHQKREQLQIQGNQIRFVHNLLTETYKVPAKFILGLELAKDGKKKKK